MSFRHFVVTRWNLGLYSRKQKTRSREVIDPERWMEHRWKLFTKYTVPSVWNQSCKDFTWIVVFDPKTPQRWVDRAYALGVTVVLGKNFRKACKKAIGTGGIVATSRLDNDDAIHRDYIKGIQDWYARKQKTGVLTYPVGWTYSPQKNKLKHYRYIRNPFLTLIEKADKKVRTILFTRHVWATDYYKLHMLPDRHSWCQIIHEKNLANRSSGVKTPADSLRLEEWWG